MLSWGQDCSGSMQGDSTDIIDQLECTGKQVGAGSILLDERWSQLPQHQPRQPWASVTPGLWLVASLRTGTAAYRKITLPSSLLVTNQLPLYSSPEILRLLNPSRTSEAESPAAAITSRDSHIRCFRHPLSRLAAWWLGCHVYQSVKPTRGPEWAAANQIRHQNRRPRAG